MAGDGIFAGVDRPFDREAYRERLRRMSGDRMKQVGRANGEMVLLFFGITGPKASPDPSTYEQHGH